MVSTGLQILILEHHIHSPYEKSIIERTVQYIKDRTEYFDYYFPCRKSKCKLQHIQKWLDLLLVIITIICYLNFTRVITGITVLILISFGNLVVGIGYVYFFRYIRLRNSN